MISSLGIIEDAKALEYEANEVEEQGRHLDSVRLMERALLLRLHVNPVDEAEACRAAERLVVKCNATAVGCFKEDQYGIATDLLQNAMRMTDEGADPLGRNPAKRRALRGTTLNNLACLERRRGRLPAALEFIEASIATASSQSPATYLNLSAILAQMGNSNQAVSAAKQAIVLLESGSSERHSLIAIAYHNLATALEPVDIVEAVGTFETALRLSLQTLGRDSATTYSIEQNLKRLRRKGPGGEGRPTQVVGSLPPIHGMRASSGRPRPHTEGGVGKGALLSSLPAHIPSINSPRLAKLPMTAGSKLKGSSMHKPAPPTAVVSSETSSKNISRNRSTSNSAVGDSRRPSTMTGPRPPGTNAAAANRRASAASGSLPARPRVGQSVFSAADMAKGEDVLTYMCSRLDALLNEEHVFDTQFAAATRIQCMCRVFRARARTQERRKARLESKVAQQSREITSARIIQRFLSRLVVLRQEQDRRTQAEVLRKQKENGAATSIQRQARIWLARNEAKRRRNFEKNHSKAVRVLQCWFRRTLAVKTVARMRRVHKRLTAAALLSEKKMLAATNIQRVWRTLLSSQVTVAARGERCAANEREVMSRRAAMVVTLQRCWRGFLGRRVANQVKAKRAFRTARAKHAERERVAAVVLQGLARGIIARKTVVPLLEARRRAHEKAALTTRTRAATTIQKTIRRALARIFITKLKACKARVVERERHTYIAMLCQRVGRGLQGRLYVGAGYYQAKNGELFALCAKEAAGRRALGAEERAARCGADMRAAFTVLKQELAVHTARRLRADSEVLMAEARQRQQEEGAKARAAVEAERLRKEEALAKELADHNAKLAWELERQNQRKHAYTKAKVDEAEEVLGTIADFYNASKEEWYYTCVEAVKQLPKPQPEEDVMSAQEEADAEKLVAKYLHDVQPREPRFKADAAPAPDAPLSEFSQKLAAAAAAQKVIDGKTRNEAATQIQRIVRGVADRQHYRTLLDLHQQYTNARVDSERRPEDSSPLVPAPPRGERRAQGTRRTRGPIPDNVGTTLHTAGSYSELERVMGSVVGYESARSNKTGRASRALEALVLGKVSEIVAMQRRSAQVAKASQNIDGLVKIVEAKRLRKEKLASAQRHRANIELQQRESVLISCLLAQCSVRLVRAKALHRIEGGIRIVNAKKALAKKRAEADASRAALKALEDEVFAAQNAAASTIQRNLAAVAAAKKEVSQRRFDAAPKAADPNESTSSQDLETGSAAELIQRNYRASLARQKASMLKATTSGGDPNSSTNSQDLEVDAAACVIQRSFRTSLARQGASARRDEAMNRRNKIKERDDVEDAAARTIQGAKKILAAKSRKSQLKEETAHKWEERRRLAADEDEADDIQRFNAAAGEYETLAATDDYEYEL